VKNLKTPSGAKYLWGDSERELAAQVGTQFHYKKEPTNIKISGIGRAICKVHEVRD